MARTITHSTLVYRLLTWLLFPAAFVYSSLVALKYKNAQYFLQRLGSFNKESSLNNLVWCHCASVGEINTALPLLKALTDHGTHLLISTNTITGYKILQNAALKNVTSVYSPLDYVFFAKKFLKAFSPKAALIFETELWPNLLLTAINQSIPVSIINGRITDKTLQAPEFLRRNYKIILAHINTILTSSEENTTRFIALGADRQKIKTLDNLKFAGLIKAQREVPECSVDFPFLLCASTHANEEEMIIKAWKENPPKELGLVIAIRHPQRTKEVCNILKANNFSYCLHSERPANAEKNEIYLIDTIGELLPFMKNAELIFMGGSLVPIGGHNLLEPAQFTKCIFTGPHYESIKEIANDLISCNGIRITKDAKALMHDINQALKSPQMIKQTGDSAKNYLLSKQGVLNTYLEHVLNIIKN